MFLMSKLKLRFFALIFAGLSMTLICPPESWAQSGAEARSIEVVGSGKASAKPDVLVLQGFVTAKDKTAKEVMAEFNQIKKSLEETINPMDFPGVEIEYEGPVFEPDSGGANPMVMMGGGGGKEPEGYSLSQSIKIRIGIDGDEPEKSILKNLSKLVDSAETTGVTFTKSLSPMAGVYAGIYGNKSKSLALGELEDAETLNKEAALAAFAEAKSKAESLAELAGGKLGKVVSIKDEETSDNNNSEPMAAYMKMIMGNQSQKRSDSINKIEVTRSLRVKFELTDK